MPGREAYLAAALLILQMNDMMLLTAVFEYEFASCAVMLFAYMETHRSPRRRYGSRAGRPRVRQRLGNRNRALTGSLGFMEFLSSCPEDQFTPYLRVTRTVFLFLVGAISAHLPIKPNSFRGDEVSAEEAVALTLLLLGSTMEMSKMEGLTGRASSTIKKWSQIVLAIICTELRQQFVQLPNEEQITNLCERMKTERGLPMCFGAIDGKCFQVLGGANEPLAFKSWKFPGKRAVNLLGLVGINYEFLWLSEIYPGSYHDSRIFRLCKLFFCILQNLWPSQFLYQIIHGIRVYPYFTADAAFAAYPCIMKPYNKTHTSYECLVYNKLQSSARQCVEQGWGFLCNRFRILKAPLPYKGREWKKEVLHVIYGSIIIYNICVRLMCAP